MRTTSRTSLPNSTKRKVKRAFAKRVSAWINCCAPGDQLTYLYDFGDDWTHRITLEAIAPLTQENQQPKCVAGGAGVSTRRRRRDLGAQ